MLVYNAIEWLTQSAERGKDKDAPLRVKASQPIKVSVAGRSFKVAPRADGYAVIEPDQSGFYEVAAQEGGAEALFAANVVDAQETTLAPSEGGAASAIVHASGRVRDGELFTWLALLAFGLLLMEWLTFHRRKTV